MQRPEADQPPALELALYYRYANYMELRERMLALQRLLRVGGNAEAALDNIDEQIRAGVSAELREHLSALRCWLQRHTAIYKDLYDQVENLRMELRVKDGEIAALHARFNGPGSDIFRDTVAQARRSAPQCTNERDVQRLLNDVEGAHVRASAAFYYRADAEIGEKQAEIMRLRAELGRLRLICERLQKTD